MNAAPESRAVSFGAGANRAGIDPNRGGESRGGISSFHEGRTQSEGNPAGAKMRTLGTDQQTLWTRPRASAQSRSSVASATSAGS